MTKLVVRLLGGFRVVLDGEVVYDFETDKARALLAYLVVEADRPHRRETLCGLLWPDQPDTVARARLRQTLYRVRQALGESAARDREESPFLFVTSTDVQFNTASDYSLDVAELEAFAREARAPVLVRHELLPARLCADFLAGFSVPDSEAFEAWVLSKQEQCHWLAMEVLGAQGELFEATDEYEQAIAAARLQIQLEPWLEEAWQRLMRSLTLTGRANDALRQYEVCCRALQAELGAEPNAATQALYLDIRLGRFLPAPRPSRTRDTDRGDPAMPALRARPRGRLVARAEELGQLQRHLEAALAGEASVAFVSGEAGSGKTVLLEAFAEAAMAECSDLLVACARCSPGSSLDAFAPLRKLAEMLFGDLGSEASWWLRGRDQLDRLGQATDLCLASLNEFGPDITGTLIPASCLARRAGRSTASTAGRELSRGLAPGSEPKAARPVSQGALFDQLLRTLAAISRGRPLLLLLDDLQWVDDATAAFLLHLGRELGDGCMEAGRILILGAYRSTTVNLGRRDPRSRELLRHPLAAAVNELRRAKGEVVTDLDRADGRAFVEALVDTEPNRLGARFRDALYAQTDGHALFTVETLRYLQARGQLFKDEAGRWVASEPLDWGDLPVRVEAAISERIDRLPATARRILSAASTQGDYFTAEMVAELTGLPVSDVFASLSGSLARQHSLVRAEGVIRAGGSMRTERFSGGQDTRRASAALAGPSESVERTRSTYRFTHHLFQKYLYEQLDPVERARWHALVAASLERQVSRDPAERAQVSATLAWHYEAGALPLPAALSLLDAGRQAMRVSAFREALSRFDHGLELLASAQQPEEPWSGDRSSIEETPSTQRTPSIQWTPSAEWMQAQQLLEVARLAPLRVLEGMGSAKLVGALSQTTDAGASRAQDSPRLLMLWQQVERRMATGQFQDALDVAERIRTEALACGEEDAAALARLYLGSIHHHDGNPREAERHLDALTACLTAERQARLRASTGIDALGTLLAISALNKWFLGYPEVALMRSAEAIDSARGAGNMVGLAEALVLGASLLFYLRVDAARIGTIADLSEECRRLCLERGIGTWRVYAEVLLGRQMVLRGDNAGGIERIRCAIADWHARGIAIGAGAYVVVLAEACLTAAMRQTVGDVAGRIRLLDTGLEAIGTLFGPPPIPCGQTYDPEVHRLRGELLLARTGFAAMAEAIDCFRRSMALAREQGALAWELRAAMSMMRLRQRQGPGHAAELADARGGLRSIYARFTEGFAFPDLQDAAALVGSVDETLRSR